MSRKSVKMDVKRLARHHHEKTLEPDQQHTHEGYFIKGVAQGKENNTRGLESGTVKTTPSPSNKRRRRNNKMKQREKERKKERRKKKLSHIGGTSQ